VGFIEKLIRNYGDSNRLYSCSDFIW